VADASSVTIRAILVDPTDSSIRNIDLPTAPGPARGLGVQIEPERLVALLGKRVSQIDLFDGEVLLVGAIGLPWHFGLDGPHQGPGVIVRYDRASDTYVDSRLSLERVADVVVFEERGARDNDEETRHGFEAA
jgi:hypothetical protein